VAELVRQGFIEYIPFRTRWWASTNATEADLAHLRIHRLRHGFSDVQPASAAISGLAGN